MTRFALVAVAVGAALAIAVGWARTVFDDSRPVERVYDHDCADGAYLPTAVCP